ncbi:hypothetical protein AAMO2058_000066800 [Amorphochlora amoebiformis]
MGLAMCKPKDGLDSLPENPAGARVAGGSIPPQEEKGEGGPKLISKEDFKKMTLKEPLTEGDFMPPHDEGLETEFKIGSAPGFDAGDLDAMPDDC